MKAQIGADVASGVVHSLVGHRRQRSRYQSDSFSAALLHGQESDVFADAGYTRADKRPELPRDRDYGVS